jgi:membrane protein YdbS with pleckstrin-like domain
LEGRAIIIAACWISVALISMAYIWVGGIDLYTDVAVGVLILVTLIVTFGVRFRELDQILRSRHEEVCRPQARSWR